MKQIRKWIALCMAVVIVAGSFSGQTDAEAKSSNLTGKKRITYSSSNKTIVSVSQKGRIHAKKKGAAKIKVVVSSEKKKVSTWLKVKVINKKKSPNFDFKKKTVKLNSGYSMPLNGIGTYSLEGDECVK